MSTIWIVNIVCWGLRRMLFLPVTVDACNSKKVWCYSYRQRLMPVIRKVVRILRCEQRFSNQHNEHVRANKQKITKTDENKSGKLHIFLYYYIIRHLSSNKLTFYINYQCYFDDGWRPSQWGCAISHLPCYFEDWMPSVAVRLCHHIYRVILRTGCRPSQWGCAITSTVLFWGLDAVRRSEAVPSHLPYYFDDWIPSFAARLRHHICRIILFGRAELGEFSSSWEWLWKPRSARTAFYG